MLKAVLPSADGEVEEKKTEQHDGIVEQYKKIIREQVVFQLKPLFILQNICCIYLHIRCFRQKAVFIGEF